MNGVACTIGTFCETRPLFPPKPTRDYRRSDFMEHERFARQADGRLQERSDFMERPSDNMAHTAQERSDSTHKATACHVMSN